MSPPAIDAEALDGLDDANDAEAAAIAVAIAAHLRDREAAAAAAAAAAAGDEETGRRSWGFAGRLSGIAVSAKRPPASTPADDWTAADRADRF
ncbi:acc operon protein [Halonotius roseus]|uniref:Acc operon protein n=1 Tax=Halonotius roseus TaxID=2511997 RepID=A0A544QM66_9EURY|nr:acc operon protein [Halonotius roseus]TQQ79699.1 acc operon protein [Halonotius roseus]